MTDVARTDAPLVNPTTGEVVPLASTTDVLAEWLLDIRDFEGRLRSEKRRATDEILARMDLEARWTARLNGYKVQGQAPGGVEYDGERLHSVLRDLVRSGLVSEAAAAAAVEEVVAYKPRKAGINALLKLGGDVAEAVESCGAPADRERRVTVSVDR